MSEKVIFGEEYNPITETTKEENIVKSFPELCSLLKHTASICWGMSIDFQNVYNKFNELEMRCNALNKHIDGLNKRLNYLMRTLKTSSCGGASNE